MPNTGIDKQKPLDQRARGLNDEHEEGQANKRNHEAQTGGPPPPPIPEKKKS